jgi:hypothetical protein
MSTHRFIVDVHFFDRTQWLPGEEVRFVRRLEVLAGTLLHGSTRGPIPTVLANQEPTHEPARTSGDSQ